MRNYYQNEKLISKIMSLISNLVNEHSLYDYNLVKFIEIIFYSLEYA